jgi:archaemetzincin
MKHLFLLMILLQIDNCAGQTEPKIALQPFDGFNMPLLDTISKSITEFYGYKVIILPEKKLPTNAFINVKSARYRADSLLDYLETIKPDSIDHIMGLTKSDISTTVRDENYDIKKPLYKYADWGVFGLGFMPGPSCVVSTFRLKHKDNIKFIDRLKKVCIHELGHNLGLNHCPTAGCVMGDANETIRTVDNETLGLCNRCKLLLK